MELSQPVEMGHLDLDLQFPHPVAVLEKGAVGVGSAAPKFDRVGQSFCCRLREPGHAAKAPTTRSQVPIPLELRLQPMRECIVRRRAS